MTFQDRALQIVKSKTVWGAIFAAVGWLLNQPHITIPAVITAIGTVLTAAGVRDAFTKYLGAPDGSPPKAPVQVVPAP